MEKLLKEKILYLVLPIFVLAIFIMLLFCGPEQTNIQVGIAKIDEVTSKENDLEAKKNKLEQLTQQKAQSEKVDKVEEKKEAKSGKKIYGVSGQQFSPEASFGIIFENLLSNVTGSGIRIRSIEYDYQPSDDKILTTNLSGYNACEISFVAVGSYTQFQTFFKNIIKETYLSNIYEVYIEPYDRDKTILIARFKIRLYTKTI